MCWAWWSVWRSSTRRLQFVSAFLTANWLVLFVSGFLTGSVLCLVICMKEFLTTICERFPYRKCAELGDLYEGVFVGCQPDAHGQHWGPHHLQEDTVTVLVLDTDTGTGTCFKLFINVFNWIRIWIQPKISIRILAILKQYRYGTYLKIICNYFIIIPFYHKKKSTERYNVVKSKIICVDLDLTF